MFLSKILILSCMITLYIAEEKIFVVVVYKLWAKEILKRHIKDCLKINRKKGIIMFKKGKYIELKSYERKMKSPFLIYTDFIML